MGNHLTLAENERKAFAELINNSNLPYKASSYTEDEERDVSLAQVYQGKKFGENTPEFHAALEEAQKYLNADLSKLDVNSFPAEFRWDDIHGYDFTGRFVDQ